MSSIVHRVMSASCGIEETTLLVPLFHHYRIRVMTGHIFWMTVKHLKLHGK